eukprot:scaffold29924_cov19-Prasinocladus_malaysianus.AAC.3
MADSLMTPAVYITSLKMEHFEILTATLSSVCCAALRWIYRPPAGQQTGGRHIIVILMDSVSGCYDACRGPNASALSLRPE